MLQLEYQGQRFPLGPGETHVGSDAGCAIRLEGQFVLPRHLVVEEAGGTVAVRRAVADAEVFINGVRLGPDPSPILHGDKLVIGTHELRVSDARQAAGTAVVDAASLAAAGGRAGPGGRGPTRNGRLVCLTDGREYQVPERGLVFGREAGCDVVVPSTEVSRRHCELKPSSEGYVLTDMSSNGTRVNGERVAGSRVLLRADVIAVGPDEFRFYAEQADEPPPAPAVKGPPAGAQQQLADTLAGIAPLPLPAPPSPAAPSPAPAPSAEKPLLASLLVRSGERKGDRLPIRVPVVNIGRADFNDVVIADPSVSTQHAKLQRRGSVWVLQDLGSTNGTLVDGEPVDGEAQLSPGATVRLGEVQLLFDPVDKGAPEAGGTAVIRAAAVPASAPPVPAAPKPRPAPAPAAKQGCLGLAVLAVGLPVATALAALLA